FQLDPPDRYGDQGQNRPYHQSTPPAQIPIYRHTGRHSGTKSSKQTHTTRISRGNYGSSVGKPGFDQRNQRYIADRNTPTHNDGSCIKQQYPIHASQQSSGPYHDDPNHQALFKPKSIG